MADVDLVTAVMAVADPRRAARAAKSAVREFLAQTWPNRELVVINASGVSIDAQDSRVREFAVPPASLGALRNRGIDEALGGWFVPWDDDDLYHPQYLELLMRHRQRAIASRRNAPDPSVAVAIGLGVQVRVDLVGKRVYVTSGRDVLAATCMYQASGLRYPEDVPFNHDATLLRSHLAYEIRSGNAARFLARVAVYHGRNAAPGSLFNRGCTTPPGSVDLPSPDFLSYVRSMLAPRGVDLTARNSITFSGGDYADRKDKEGREIRQAADGPAVGSASTGLAAGVGARPGASAVECR